MQGLNLSQPGLKHDPQWFKKAVFYEVLVRAFADSKGVGAGDFTGLIPRLDQHPWFQASRAEPDGPYGNFYVWSDTDDGYDDARIIFVDTEVSNWTFDPVRRQFFWHRFFSHQPDLNFENPAVQDAIIDALR